MMLRLLVCLLTMVISLSAYAESIKVALVLDKGGKDDKSFNSAAYAGATRAKKDFDIHLKYVEATDAIALENMHRAFARKNYDLIIGIGFAQIDAVKKVSAKFPHVNFAVVDCEINSPNVRSILFEEHEGSFLVGALAALKSTSGKVGFIGGMDIPLIRRFAMGYAAGAKYINPKIQVVENFIGITGDAWNNPAKAKELALSQFGQNVDVSFVAAGASGNGVFDAAEETNKLAIGVDSNQNWVKPGFILTSMIKGVEPSVYETIKAAVEKKFTAGVMRFALKNNGVDYTLDQFNEKLITPEMKKKVAAIKQDIIAGKIQVPDYYKKK